MSGLAGNIAASFLSKAWSALLGLAFVPLYVKLLGIESYGVIGAFVSLQALLALLDLGLGPALTRQLAAKTGTPEQARDLVRSLEVVYWATSVLIGLVVWGLSSLLATKWLNPHGLEPVSVAQAITLAGLAFALQWPSNLYNGGLTGLHRQKLLAVIVASSGTLRVGLTLLALYSFKPSLQVFFAAQALANCIQSAWAAIALWRSLEEGGRRARFDRAAIRGVFRFAAGMTGISITTVILTQLDKAVLSRALSLEAFGYYAVASTLAAGLYIVIGPIFTVMFPRFSQIVAKGDQPSVRSLYHLSAQFMSVAILPLTAMIAFFAPEILWLWTRDPNVANHAHALLSLLILGNAMNGLMNIPYAVQLAHGWTRLAFYSNCVAILIFAPLSYFLALRFGAIGGALVWVSLTLAYILVSLPLMHHRLLRGAQGRWYLTDVGAPALATFGVVGLGRWLAPELSPGPGMVCFLAGLGMLATIGGLLAAPDVRLVILRYARTRRWAGWA